MLSREENQQFKVILGYRKRDQKRVGRERMEEEGERGQREEKWGEGERGRLREGRYCFWPKRASSQPSCWEMNCVPQESIICRNLNSLRIQPSLETGSLG